MNKTSLSILTFAVLIGLASAGTVTLTGGCRTAVITNNTVQFHIVNSGNDTAFNMVLTPVLTNAQPVGAYTINSLGPLQNATLMVKVANITEKGTSPAYFVAAYQQGSNVFTAVFPCLLSFFNATTSQVLLSANALAFSNGTAKVTVSAFDAGASDINANVSLVVPPTFSFSSSKYYTIGLTPYQTTNVYFTLQYPAGSTASYSIAALSSYSHDNLSYGTFTAFIIAPPKLLPTNTVPIFTYVVAAVIVLILALIAFSVLRKRGPKQSAGVVQ